ncbi:hypothetical protein [Providencia huaxiensis]|uniref:hypothetical protein n=1 Tax=Providencia huaxiensis TaxID=2027290 RepID=UPI0028825F55|nr:hypothetical protein [Providencia rettgeri]
MGSKFKFYAVCDSDGNIVSIKDKQYPSIKAIFYWREDAERVLSKNIGENLHISEVNIIEADNE